MIAIKEILKLGWNFAYVTGICYKENTQQEFLKYNACFSIWLESSIASFLKSI